MFKLLKNNDGMTIISIVVAFAILITASVLFAKSMQISTNMIKFAENEKAGIEDSVEKYYSEKASEATTEVTMEFFEAQSEGATASVNPDLTLKMKFGQTQPETKPTGENVEHSYGFQFFVPD